LSCNDGSATTRTDVCTAGTCAGTTYSCTPSGCEATSVPNGVDCTKTYLPATTACDDGVAGTKDDQCDAAGACVGTAYTCTATQCQSASVPDGEGCVVTNASAGRGCDDGDPCTKIDQCDGEGGCVGTAVTCGDGEVCTRPAGCTATHCASCENDAECGRDSACLGTEDGDRCLLSCVRDDDCTSGQVCKKHENGTMRCFDADGECAAPVEVADEGPEPNPEVVEVVEEVEADTTSPDTIDTTDTTDTTDTVDTIDTSTGDTAEATDTKTSSGGKGGCAGGGDGSWLLGAALMALVAVRVRRSAKAD
jgi:hypothetical protein